MEWGSYNKTEMKLFSIQEKRVARALLTRRHASAFISMISCNYNQKGAVVPKRYFCRGS